jgi:hypothetical protein
MLGDNVSVHSNDITNRRPNGDPDLAGTRIILGSSETIAAETSIKGNRIHRCGQMPRISREHGIYASRPRGAKIFDNLIYGWSGSSPRCRPAPQRLRHGRENEPGSIWEYPPRTTILSRRCVLWEILCEAWR